MVNLLEREAELCGKLSDALRESNEILQNIFSLSPVAIGLIENERFVWVNDMMYDMFGYEIDDYFDETPFSSIFTSEAQYKNIKSRMKTGFYEGEVLEVDLQFKKKDGSVFDGNIRMKKNTESKSNGGMVFSLMDISKRKRIESERLMSEKFKSILQVAGAVCHEFNQPLQAIAGFSRLLKEDLPKDNVSHLHLRVILEQVDRMSELTNKLMNITKIETMDYLNKLILDIERSSASLGKGSNHGHEENSCC